MYVCYISIKLSLTNQLRLRILLHHEHLTFQFSTVRSYQQHWQHLVLDVQTSMRQCVQSAGKCTGYQKIL